MQSCVLACPAAMLMKLWPRPAGLLAHCTSPATSLTPPPPPLPPTTTGNVTERTRAGGLPASGETVVDLYTGIGYYTLPLLARAGVAKVYACEWNPHALEALRWGVCVGGVGG